MVSKTQQVFLDILKGDVPTQMEGMDLDELFRLFQRHRLFNLAPAIRESVGEEEWKRWKQAIQSRTIKSLHQTSVLAQFVEEFQKEGIEVIPLKGPVLAQSLYGNIADRHYTDLDVLIRSADIKNIIQIAERQGFELGYPDRKLSPRQWAYYFRYKKDIGLFNRQHNIFVELHLGVYYHRLFEQEGEKILWEDLVNDSVGSTAIRRMNNNNTFLYLTFHGGLHQYFRLFWLRDVAACLEKWDLDHQQIIEKARALGIERLIFVSVLLAQDYFKIELPQIYHEFIAGDKRRIDRIKKLFANRIEGPEQPSFAGRMSRHYVYLLLKPGFYYYWSVLWSIVNRWYIKKFLGGH